MVQQIIYLGGKQLEKPKLTKEIMQSERLRAKYVRDVIDYLAWKLDVKHVLSKPIETNQNKY
jgi:hypothetical protein